MTAMAVACFAISNFFRGFGIGIYITFGAPYLDDNVSKRKMPSFFAFVFAYKLLRAPFGFYMSILLIAIGSFFDLLLIYLSPRLGNLYDDDDDDEVKSNKSTLKGRLMFWKPGEKKKITIASEGGGTKIAPTKTEP